MVENSPRPSEEELIALGAQIMSDYELGERVSEKVTFRGKSLTASHFLLNPACQPAIDLYAERLDPSITDERADQIDSLMMGYLTVFLDGGQNTFPTAQNES